MIRDNKWKLLASSMAILLPVLFGALFWNELPEQMVTHWGINGAADGWSSRAFAVFVLPLSILAVHWLCVFCTALDPKNKGQNKKMFGLVIWITPIVSLFANGVVYGVSLGKEFQPYLITNLLMGTVFIVIGNYLPKCKQNYTIGIKVKWTLENEENWNATHRFGGKVWVVGGLLLLTCVFLPDGIALWGMVGSIITLVVLPIVYSYLYYKKQVREGTAVITPVPKSKVSKKVKMISLIGLAGVLVFVGLIMFTGDIDINYGGESFTIEADYWFDLTVEYDAIEKIEYRDNDNRGLRTNGLGSARLLTGAFRNEEFGNYTRYSYTGCEACVVLTVAGKILVLNGPDTQKTREVYEMLKIKQL
ncbi:MAG: DUF1648 domain-containing protein [Ruminococcaceae bacterium]|nr:DUF1648 domain-containing protein [Oscillospiraceae bacterium]